MKKMKSMESEQVKLGKELISWLDKMIEEVKVEQDRLVKELKKYKNILNQSKERRNLEKAAETKWSTNENNEDMRSIQEKVKINLRYGWRKPNSHK